jgi:hypothetical protein
MQQETQTAYALAARVCAFLGAATGILTKRGMALTFTAVVLSHAPDWKRGLAWGLVAAIWYVIVWLVCRGRTIRTETSKIGKQQHLPAACPDFVQTQLTSAREEDYEHGGSFEYACLRKPGGNRSGHVESLSTSGHAAETGC